MQRIDNQQDLERALCSPGTWFVTREHLSCVQVDGVFRTMRHMLVSNHSALTSKTTGSDD